MAAFHHLSTDQSINFVHYVANLLIIDDGPRYERDNRSASPRPAREDNDEPRRRSISPNGHPDRYVVPT